MVFVWSPAGQLG